MARSIIPATLGTLLLVAVGCKSLGSGENSQTSATSLAGRATSADCGPQKTIYFHWMTENAAVNWEKAAGVANPAPEEETLTPRTGPWLTVTGQLMDGLVARVSDATAAAGPGIYLAGTTISSSNYGERLLLFRLTGPDGKGVSCPQDEHFDKVNNQSKGAARNSLPLLVKFETKGFDSWFVSPRVADRTRGEQMVFDRPHEGDAELAASELIFGKTRLELLRNFYGASGIGEMGSNGYFYCRKNFGEASERFYRKVLCQSLPDRLAQALAALPHTPLTPDENQALSAIVDANKSSQINSEALDKVLKSFDSSKSGAP